MPTISSLHIGQTMRLLAAAAACAEPCSSRAMREVRSSWSVDIGVLEVCDDSDTELSEGDNRPGVRTVCWMCLGVTVEDVAGDGGARPLPDPSTRPPPRLLRAAMPMSRVFVHQRAHTPSCLRTVAAQDL